MLETLNLGLISKKLSPIPAIMLAINCSEKTAYNKLRGKTDFTLPEAIKIVETYFPEDDISIKELFAREDVSA